MSVSKLKIPMAKVFSEMARQSLKDAHQTLEDTMKDVTSKVAHYKPAGKALPIVAAYAHVIISEDLMLSSWALKKKALIEGAWAKKTGLSVMHPNMDQDWEKNYVEWIRVVKADMTQLRKYAKAVYAKTDREFAAMTDKDMTSLMVDLSGFGMGKWPMLRFTMRFLLSHVDSLTGEISTVKGLQGLKGYPF